MAMVSCTPYLRRNPHNGNSLLVLSVLWGRTHYGYERTQRGDWMSEFLALIEWFDHVLGLIAAAAFGFLVALVLVALGWIEIREYREP